MSEIPLQQRVQPWMMASFGPTISADEQERNHRFLEEALELVQACGATASEAHQLVDYVYGRPVGEPAQEVGGVMVTLTALCLANDLDMHEAGEVELARIWTKVEQIRAKQAAKPKHSPLPAAPEQPAAYTCKHGCERDALKDRIAELEAQLATANEREASDYSELLDERNRVNAMNYSMLNQLAAAPVAQDRHVLQAEGRHPAPCARHCEAQAFKIEADTLRHGLRLANDRIADLTAPVAGQPANLVALHAECKRVAHNAIHDAIYKIDDCEPVKAAVRDALDSIDLAESSAQPAPAPAQYTLPGPDITERIKQLATAPAQDPHANDSTEKLIADMRVATASAKRNKQWGMSAFIDHWIERLMDMNAAQLAAPAQGEPSDTDPNAPWLTLAHMICADAGIPPGHITARLAVLRDKLEAPAQDARECKWLADAMQVQPFSGEPTQGDRQPETWKVLPSPVRVTGEILHQAFPEIPGEPWPLAGVRKAVWERFAERVNARLAGEQS